MNPKFFDQLKIMELKIMNLNNRNKIDCYLIAESINPIKLSDFIVGSIYRVNYGLNL
jgi:hypothetical protein